MSYNGREALQLALGSVQNAQYDPNRNALTTIQLNSDGTDALLKRARAFERFLDKSDKRSRKGSAKDSELKSEGRAYPSEGETTGWAVPAEAYSEAVTTEAPLDKTPAEFASDAADRGWNEALDAVQKAADDAGYGEQARTILFGMTK